jgi:hypothetical protein
MECLAVAGSRMDPHYFQIDVADAKEAVYRERAYCYELYHHLRICLEGKLPHKLHGELDKSGHPIIRPEKPDFVLHEPGKHNGNLVVMEVKPVTTDKSGIEKDLRTLNHFLKVPRYDNAVMLVYGNNKMEMPDWIPSEVHKKGHGRITLFWHQGVGHRPIAIDL